MDTYLSHTPWSSSYHITLLLVTILPQCASLGSHRVPECPASCPALSTHRLTPHLIHLFRK